MDKILIKINQFLNRDFEEKELNYIIYLIASMVIVVSVFYYVFGNFIVSFSFFVVLSVIYYNKVLADNIVFYTLRQKILNAKIDDELIDVHVDIALDYKLNPGIYYSFVLKNYGLTEDELEVIKEYILKKK